MTAAARPDRLSLWMVLILAAGILFLSWLVLDATGAFRAAPAAPAQARAELPRTDCPTPGPGGRLHILIELQGGKFTVACNTIRPFIPMRPAAR